MSVVIIAYPPSGGGNHLKNILCLDPDFANSNDLNRDRYVQGDREVHSTLGRNLHDQRIAEAESATRDYILHGHFGELALWRNRINAISNKRWIVLSIDTTRDKNLLNSRQHQLGQFGHEYYLTEEQPYLYHADIYRTYFTSTPENVYTIALNDFWHGDLGHYKIIEQLNNFLNKNVDITQAQVLHRYWHINNNIIDFY